MPFKKDICFPPPTSNFLPSSHSHRQQHQPTCASNDRMDGWRIERIDRCQTWTCADRITSGRFPDEFRGKWQRESIRGAAADIQSRLLCILSPLGSSRTIEKASCLSLVAAAAKTNWNRYATMGWLVGWSMRQKRRPLARNPAMVIAQEQEKRKQKRNGGENQSNEPLWKREITTISSRAVAVLL